MSYTVQAAADGGYIVYAYNGVVGSYGGVLFAGTIDECLVYVKNKLYYAPVQPS